jgi:hypothetical protein
MKLFLGQHDGIFSTVACEFMERSLSTPCVASSFWGCIHDCFIDSQLMLLVHLILGCVGWFFESVIGHVLDSGCQLKTVVCFEFCLPGCTSYPDCLQLVTVTEFLASYLWWFFLSCREDWDSICIRLGAGSVLQIGWSSRKGGKWHGVCGGLK